MNWLENISKNIWIQGLVITSILMGSVFIIGSLLFLVKPAKNRKSIKYIYSFASGFVLITAIIGQFVTAREKLTNFYESKDNDIVSESAETWVSLAIILAGVIIGALIAMSIHKIFIKYNNHKNHDKIHTHDHTLDNEYDLLMHGHSKIPGILMLTAHRFPAGLAMGGLLYNSTVHEGGYSMVALIAFIVHIIPELLIVYFGLLDSGKTKKQTFLFSTLAKLVIIPGIFIGIAIGKLTNVESMFWFQPLIFMIVGTLLVWGVVLELVPEFIHHKSNGKTISSMSIVFISGLSLSLFIQFIHSH